MKKNLRQWLAWRDDYRCARPAVSCQNCDTHFPPDQNATVMVFQGFNLIRCSECEKQEEPQILFPHVYRRVFRDVVHRYIQRFGGQTFTVQTADDDCEVFLRNCRGDVIATVSMFDKFPKHPPESAFAEMPF